MIDAKHTNVFFPIQTATACPLKWNWSSLTLTNGVTASCHRTGQSKITPDDFANFHNTDVKLEDRKKMLAGEWPESNCSYCKQLETTGRFSDRKLHLTTDSKYAVELRTDPTAINITPTILEVFFDNTCNLKCLYCKPELSSMINGERIRFGSTQLEGSINLEIFNEKQITQLIPKFWEWMDINFVKLHRFHYMGGEPLIQKYFHELLEFIDTHPNPECQFNIISNLMVDHETFVLQLSRIHKLILDQKLGRFDLTASIDCWGNPQEYVRFGINLELWEKNFKYALSQDWIYLNINQTVSALTIKTMPELLTRLIEYRKIRSVGHFFGVATRPTYMNATIFGPSVFSDDFVKILSLMPDTTDELTNSKKYMESIAMQVLASTKNEYELSRLRVYLDEHDRRRGNDWKVTFPWLVEIL